MTPSKRLELRTEMDRLASMLPEYELVMGMEGIGKVTGPQLMAEVGDVRRFSHKGALVAYAGVDASPYQSEASIRKAVMCPNVALHILEECCL